MLNVQFNQDAVISPELLNRPMADDIEVLACIPKGRTQYVYHSYIKGFTEEAVIIQQCNLALEGYSNFKLMTWAEWEQLDIMQCSDEYQVNTAVPSDHESFKEQFNLLQPYNWVRGESFEYFEESERITGRLTTFYARLGKGVDARYFKIHAESGTLSTLIHNFCLNAIKAEEELNSIA